MNFEDKITQLVNVVDVLEDDKGVSNLCYIGTASKIRNKKIAQHNQYFILRDLVREYMKSKIKLRVTYEKDIKVDSEKLEEISKYLTSIKKYFSLPNLEISLIIQIGSRTEVIIEGVSLVHGRDVSELKLALIKIDGVKIVPHLFGKSNKWNKFILVVRNEENKNKNKNENIETSIVNA